MGAPRGRSEQDDGGRNDGGQVLPLVAVLVALVGVAALTLGRVGGATVARASAVAAADAAALAGAVDGRAGAEEVARANGARLVGFSRSPSPSGAIEAVAEVRLGRARARARARQDPAVSGVVGTGRAAVAGLAPGLRAALQRAEALLGTSVPVVSGFRTRADQERLWQHRAANPYPVARPGTSRHEQGLAVDVPRSFVSRLLAVAGRAGLCQPLPASDPVHFELCAGRAEGS